MRLRAPAFTAGLVCMGPISLNLCIPVGRCGTPLVGCGDALSSEGAVVEMGRPVPRLRRRSRRPGRRQSSIWVGVTAPPLTLIGDMISCGRMGTRGRAIGWAPRRRVGVVQPGRVISIPDLGGGTSPRRPAGSTAPLYRTSLGGDVVFRRTVGQSNGMPTTSSSSVRGESRPGRSNGSASTAP